MTGNFDAVGWTYRLGEENLRGKRDDAFFLGTWSWRRGPKTEKGRKCFDLFHVTFLTKGSSVAVSDSLAEGWFV
jgi:hypothetical protein